MTDSILLKDVQNEAQCFEKAKKWCINKGLDWPAADTLWNALRGRDTKIIPDPVKYIRYMDDWIILANARWQLKKAIKF